MSAAKTESSLDSRSGDKECLLKSAASVLTAHPLLKAISIDRTQGQVSIASFGPDPDPELGETVKRSLTGAKSSQAAEPCHLLDRDTGCSECSVSLESIRSQGYVITEQAGLTTIARASCPTAQRFWRWRGFPLPRIAPREVRIPEAETELNEWKAQAGAAAACGLLALVACLAAAPGWSMALYGLSFAAGGFFAAKEAWPRVRERVLDIHFLMLTVAAGSAAVGAWGEGAMLLFLFSSSGALESYAMGRTQREIRSLFRTAPKTATLVDDLGKELEVPVEGLSAGQKLRIKPGSQFPVDAEVVKGKTAADESTLTGEAIPIEKAIGDTVLAGTLNLWGAIEVVVLRPVQESSLEKVIRLIRQAQHLKAPSQRFTDKFGSGYTYAIIGLTVVMFLVWWLGMGLPAFVSTENRRSAFYRAMTLLVVASPCALVLSIPSAVLAAIAWGARRGILFRGGAAVEKLAGVNVVALDKTGTLTTGELGVESIQSFPPGRESEVAQLAYSLERHSHHPLARAITQYGKQRGLTPIEFEHFESVTGSGLEAKHRGRTLRLGKREWLMQHLGDDARWQAFPATLPSDAGLSEVWVADGDLMGRIELRDDIRPQTAPVLEQLQQLGVHPTVLTGDRPGAAMALQRTLGLEDVRSQLKPEDKVQAIRGFMAQGKQVAMIGDGVNDAPSLAVAHVGVAMGARGADAALEQAEIVLMHDRLENFVAALVLSRKARRVIRQNLFISLGVVVVLVGFAAAGQIPLTLGVLGHEGSTVLVVLNSLRLLFVKCPSRPLQSDR